MNSFLKLSVITPPLNKQQADSEISEIPVSYKRCFEEIFKVKEKTSKQYSRNRNYLPTPKTSLSCSLVKILI